MSELGQSRRFHPVGDRSGLPSITAVMLQRRDWTKRATCCLRRRAPLACAGRQLIERIADIDLGRVACSTSSTAAQCLPDMCATVTLASHRVRLRPWRAEDREPFAEMNADVRVMEFFRSPLDRSESDALIERIQNHFEEHGFGLWALEVPGKDSFVGFCGLTVTRFNAAFTPCVEVGWRLAFEHWGQGYAQRPRRRCSRTLSTRSSCRKWFRSHQGLMFVRRRSWTGSGCVTIRRTTSIIQACRQTTL